MSYRYVAPFLLFGALVSASLEAAQAIPNWSAPSTWSPTKTSHRVTTQADITNPLPFIGVAPCRIADTRGNGFTGQYGPPALVADAMRTFTIAGQCGIPVGAAAVSLNLVALNVGANGDLRVFPTGGAVPLVSTLNYNANTPNIANAAVVPLGTGGAITVQADAASIDLIIDTNGYYARGVVTSANGVTGDLTINGAGATIVSTVGNVITVNSSTAAVPSGTYVLGAPGDTSLISAGFTEVGPVGIDVWRATSTAGAPSGRYYHTAVWTGSRMLIWGGSDGNSAVNSGAAYDPVANSWTPLSTIGAPTSREQHTAIWTGSKMVVWGGFDGATPDLNTGGLYNPGTDSWAPTSTTGAPSERRFHTAVWTGTKMIVWGGSNESTFLNTGGRYDPGSDTWLPTTTTSAPAGRYGHTATWSGSRMIVWGGGDNTGGLYDPVLNLWTPTSTTGAPQGRLFHTAVWTGTSMLVWGGIVGGVGVAVTNDGGAYNPGGDSWTAITTTGAPAGRYAHTAVWTGSRMVVWGGSTAGPVLGDGGQFDPIANTWIALTQTGAPTPRVSHTAVWTGDKMIVWGGTGGGFVNTGGYPITLSTFLKP